MLAATDDEPTRVTPWGVGMFITTVLIAASAIPSLRIEVGGLSVHASLVPLGILFGLSLQRCRLLPGRVLPCMVAFLALYAVSTIPDGFDAGEVAKVAAALVMIAAGAVVPRNSADSKAAIVGMAIAIALISVRGLAGVESELAGANPLDEIANKNAFSLYALPMLLIAGYLFVAEKTSKLTKLILVGAAIVTVVTIFSTGNRSGWGGVFLVAAMLMASGAQTANRVRVIGLVTLLALGTYSVYREWGTAAVVQHRVDQTLGGYESDNYRVELAVSSIEVGLENPLLGASPRGLGVELSRRVVSDLGAVDPHNVIAHVFGGSGVLTLLALLALGYALWSPVPFSRTQAFADGRRLTRFLLVLWFFRGMFTREVLYSPTFCIAIGLALGWAMRGMLANPSPSVSPTEGLWQSPRPVPPR